ncbi:MAG TPA: hypothetical protein VFA18_15850 [Gemmataceae bacterium]|nr:hypothetical protein [Gemmataceae bacterium]
MKAVSRFEADLLHILHALLGRAPLESVLPRLSDRSDRPPCLSRDAVDLIEDALAKGCVLRLARAGGWKRERHLRGDRVADGRMWERTAPADMGLYFSAHSLRFLLTLTADWPEDWARFHAAEHELTIGDLFLLYLAFEVFRSTKLTERLQANSIFETHALCRLAFPEDFTRARNCQQLNWGPWLTGVGACILEAWQDRLAQRWQHIELGRRALKDVGALHALAQAETQVLDSFLKAAEQAGRRDLARFVLRTAALLLPAGITWQNWRGTLPVADLRLAERVEVQRAALAFARQLGHLHQWEQEARTIGYFDDGYQAAQWWKSEWERHGGDAVWSRAQTLLRAAEPLRSP